jgi:hypothetical protein
MRRLAFIAAIAGKKWHTGKSVSWIHARQNYGRKTGIFQ